MRLLVVEDNPKMARLLRQGLAENGYAVDLVDNGAEAVHLASSHPYDLIVLDVMLPEQDGLRACSSLRTRRIATPVLMLTALSTTQDKISGLDAGADDYLTKPFEFDELLARVRALLRRGQAKETCQLEFADLEMDLLSRKVTRAGRQVQLTAKEFSLLEFFMRNPDRVLSRTSIGEHVWDMNFDSDSNVIDVYVSMLRRKMDKGFAQRLIHTVIGTGYVLRTDGDVN